MSLPPYAKLRRLPGAAPVEPLTLADAKQYLNLDTPDTDAQVQDLIVAARAKCEQIANRSLVASAWQLTLDSFYGNSRSRPPTAWPWGWSDWGYFDDVIELPEPPLVAVQSIQYLGQDNTPRTLDPAMYLVSPGTPGRIEPAFGAYWPFTEPEIAAVNIQFASGFGDDPAQLAAVRQGMRHMVALFFTSRSTAVPIPDAIDYILGPAKFYGYA